MKSLFKILLLLWILFFFINADFFSQIETMMENAKKEFDELRITVKPFEKSDKTITVKLEKKVNPKVTYAGETFFWLYYNSIYKQDLFTDYECWKLYFNARAQTTPNVYYLVLVEKDKKNERNGIWINKYFDYFNGISKSDIEEWNKFIDNKDIKLKDNKEVIDYITFFLNFLRIDFSEDFFLLQNINDLPIDKTFFEDEKNKIKSLQEIFRDYELLVLKNNSNYSLRFMSWNSEKLALIYWKIVLNEKGEILTLGNEIAFKLYPEF